MIRLKSFLFPVLLFAVGTVCCQTTPNNKKVTVSEFEQLLKNNPEKIILDVRTPGEFTQGHLSNALNIDYTSADFKTKVAGLDKTKPVFVYCATGIRSTSAAKTLSQLGFENIYNLSGGIQAWTRANKPTEK
jgi:rhodanese-related sulfurtransferase